ncbi:MAG: hypothetical protein ACR2QL_02660, partial [Woeseiaceae bacterium]
MRISETPRNILAAVGALTIVYVLFHTFVPMFNSHVEITEGSYRGLEIGANKATIATTLSNGYGRFSKLKLTGFDDGAGGNTSVFYNRTGLAVVDSDIWYLRHPGLHQ